MVWARLKGRWKLLRDAGKRAQRAGRIQEASQKQIAEWLAREHKTDPIHK